MSTRTEPMNRMPESCRAYALGLANQAEVIAKFHPALQAWVEAAAAIHAADDTMSRAGAAMFHKTGTKEAWEASRADALKARQNAFPAWTAWVAVRDGEKPVAGPFGEDERAAMFAAWDAGSRLAVSDDLADHFLEVLPPARMGGSMTLVDGTVVRVAFAFVEGADRLTAFWRERSQDWLPGAPSYRWLAQYTTAVSDGG